MTIFLLQAEGHLPGEVFSFGIHVNGPPTGADDALTAWIAALADLMDTDAGAGNTLKSHYPTSVGIDDASAASLDPATGRQEEKAMGAAVHVGTSLVTMLPHSTALAVSLRTTLATRSGRGRFYLPPPDTDSCLSGRATTSLVNAVVAGVSAAFDTLLGGGYNPVIWHRATLTWTDVNRIDVGDVFDDQRRRRNKLVEVRVTATVP